MRLPENCSGRALPNGQTFTGVWRDVSEYNSVVVALLTDTSCTLYVEFSPEGIFTDSTLSYTVAANVNEVHRITVTRSYCKIRVTNNSGSDQTFLRLSTIAGNHNQLTSALNSTIQGDSDSLITRSTIIGQTDSGDFQYVPVTQEGHLEVALHSPRLPFGSIHTESLTPIFQSDGVYGLNSGQVDYGSSLSGSVSVENSSFKISSGTTLAAQAYIQSRKRLRYRAGQGVIGRFAGLFTSPVAYSYQLIGFGHAEDGYYFGYKDITGSIPEFGILHVKRGVREVQTLTVTVGATSASNCTITLNTVAFTVPLTAASNIQRTVYEIASFTYTGWKAYPSGATIVFVADDAGNKAGTFSFGAGTTGASASFAETKAGATSTETFIPQSEWNGDKLNGTGASGITLNPQAGNVYQIGIQYLGYGSVEFKVETASSDTNNPEFVTCHVIKHPNTLTDTHIGNPSFPFTMAVYSAGSTTDLSLKVGSFAGFIEGLKVLHGNRFSYFNFITTGNASTIVPLFSVINSRYYSGRTNQAVVNLLSVSGAVKHTQPVVYYLIRNGTLGGNPNFAVLSTNSCTLWDTTATSVTYSNNNQLLWTGHLGETGEIDHHFSNGNLSMEELTLQPGEWVTLAVKSVANNIAYATGALNTREDQ